MRRIDSHQHFWRLDRGDYGWLTPDLTPLYRDFGPADLAPLLAAHGIAGSIAVQAAPTEAETHYLLGLAAAHPSIVGVIGWTDLAAPDAPARIAVLAADPLLKGVRAMLQDLADDDFILAPAVQPALAAIERLGLRLDLLVRPRHLARIPVLRARFPDLAMVIDHGGKPEIAGRRHAEWAGAIAAIAADGQTCSKLSGLVTEAGPGWSTSQLAPYAATILDSFGPRRVMWGSDWPVLTLAARYDDWVGATDTLLAGLNDADCAEVRGGTAAHFYELETG